MRFIGETSASQKLCGFEPDAAVCDHAHELIAARPRDSPSFVALGESNHDVVRRLAQTRFSSVRVNEYVGIDCDQGVPGSL